MPYMVVGTTRCTSSTAFETRTVLQRARIRTTLQVRDAPYPTLLELLDVLKKLDVPVVEVLDHCVETLGVAAYDLGGG